MGFTSLTVIPGYTWVSGGMFMDSDTLNATANPVVRINDGALPAAALDGDDFITTFGDSFRALNFLPDGAFHYAAFKPGTVACPVGVRTEPVRSWYVLPSGAALEAVRDAAAPDTRSGHSLKVTGASGCTAVRLGTYLPPGVTTLAQLGTVVFSVWLYNNTGSAITPGLEITTSATEGDEGNLNSPVTVAGTACPSGQWTRLSYSITTASVSAAAWKRGAHLALAVTAGGGVMDVTGDYLLIAQAALDQTALSASWTPVVQQPSPFPAGFQLPWPGDSTSIPEGWLFCNGAAVSRTTYRRLFDVIGTAYGTGDGSTTFNVPDLRGGLPVGAEVSGSSQSRLELELSGCGTTNASAVLTVSSTANLRTGMGAFHANLPAGTTISSIDSTTQVTLSATATATASPVTVRFSRLGTADPQTIGSAGNRLATPARKVAITLSGCATTNGSQILTVPDVLSTGLASGMIVDAAGVPAGTTITSFVTATTVKLSAAATATATVSATFRVDATESDAWEQYQHLLKNPVIFCSWNGGAPDTTLQMQAGLSALIRKGWAVSGTGITSGTYVTGISGGTPDDFNITPGTTGSAPGAYPAGSELTFSGSTIIPAATTSEGPRMVAQNWMIKI